MKRIQPRAFFSVVPEAFSIHSELLWWKFNFMGDDDTDGILVSGQLELCYFSNKSVSNWQPDLSFSTVCDSVYYKQLLLSKKKKRFAQIINKFSTTFCMCACATVCSVLPWVILDLSALANVCFDSAHLCDPWTIIISTIIIFHLFHANPNHLRSTVPSGVHHYFILFNLLNVSFIWQSLTKWLRHMN